jgi:hypothetical protein
MKTYFWDFVGPVAKEKAAHHVKHLEEFFQREALSGCEAGVVAHSPVRHSAWLKATPEAQAVVEKALRPPRFEESNG